MATDGATCSIMVLVVLCAPGQLEARMTHQNFFECETA